MILFSRPLFNSLMMDTLCFNLESLQFFFSKMPSNSCLSQYDLFYIPLVLALLNPSSSYLLYHNSSSFPLHITEFSSRSPCSYMGLKSNRKLSHLLISLKL